MIYLIIILIIFIVFQFYIFKKKIDKIKIENIKILEENEFKIKEINNKNKLIEQDLKNLKLSKNSLLVNMSHEIRIPMNSILGFTDILLYGETDFDKIEMLSNIKKSGNELLSLINYILELDEIRKKQINLNEIDFMLSDLLESVINSVEKSKKEININYEIDNAIPKALYGDTEKLNKILFEIINNYVSLVSNKGAVHLSINLIKKEDKNVYLEFVIKENIQDFSKDKLKNIFLNNEDEFKTSDFLSISFIIAKKLIEFLNGKIKIEEGPNQEMSIMFYLMMGISEMNEEETMEIEEIKATSNQSKKLILAEDNQINRDFFKAFFTMENYEFKIVENGQELVNEFEKGDYKLILTDIQMPVMSGYEAAKNIRKSKKGKSIPIVGISAFYFDKDSLELKKSEINEFISKPVSIKKLKEAINKYLN